MNLLKALKKLITNPRDFFRKWKEGYKRLNTLDFIKAKVTGHRIMIVGVIVGAAGMIISRFYYLLILFAGMLWLQVYEHKRANDQRKAQIEMQQQMEEGK